MKTKNVIQHALVAYRCRIKYRERNNPQRETYKEEIANKEEPNYSFDNLIKEFCSYFSETNKAIKSDTSQRVVAIYDNYDKIEKENNVLQYYLRVNSGKADRPFNVIDINDIRKKSTFESTKSATYPHDVFFYYDKETKEIIAVFHHFGNASCKTAFFNAINNFLFEKGFYFVMEVILCNELDESFFEAADARKVILTREYEIIPEDIADAKKNKTKKFVDYEVSLNLTSPTFFGLKKKIEDHIIKKALKKDITDTIKTCIALPDEEYEGAKLLMNVGGFKRVINFDGLCNLIGEHYITKNLDYDDFDNPIFESLEAQAYSYYLTVKETKKEVIK